MDPFIASNDLLQIRIYCTMADQTALNIRHYRAGTVTGTSIRLSELALAFSADIAPLYKDVLSNQATYYGVDVARLYPGPVTPASSNRSASGVGLAGTPVMPRQVCGLLTIRSALIGRANRGRLYIPFPAVDDDSGGGTPTAGYVTRSDALGAYLAALNTYIGAGGSLVTIPVIYHRATNTATDVTQVYSTGKFATQRRRGAYGRANLPPF